MLIWWGLFFHFLKNNSVPFCSAGGGGDALDEGDEGGDADEEADDDAGGAEVVVEDGVRGGNDREARSAEAGGSSPEVSGDLGAEEFSGHGVAVRGGVGKSEG